ncbi:MAG: hypothetical protein MUF49_25410 [Oculatellaceae cyanobacterium Prado106]|jgi:hypothetical protein|nr:hypothetical protein [Oculatellaceae cyanobacterium Prado106]
MDIESRHKVLCTYFEGRDWDRNGEYVLKRELVLMREQLLPNYPYVIEDEWEVEPGRTDKGRGDLVFSDGMGRFAVVEVKWLDLLDHEQSESTRNGDTRRVSNRKKRRKVEKQALEYAKAYEETQLREDVTVLQVEAYLFTNDYDRPKRINREENL